MNMLTIICPSEHASVRTVIEVSDQSTLPVVLGAFELALKAAGFGEVELEVKE